jgi:hypothetical protein
MASWTVGLVIPAFRQSEFDAKQNSSNRCGRLSCAAAVSGVGSVGVGFLDLGAGIGCYL